MSAQDFLYFNGISAKSAQGPMYEVGKGKNDEKACSIQQQAHDTT
jgi:hypothetical protein